MYTILLFLSLMITIVSQLYINTKYNKTNKIQNANQYTGKEVARIILDKNGLKNVKIKEVTGTLSDHYDPQNKIVNLSSDIYNSKTIAAISVASHECGHAIQDKNGYLFLRIRSSIVPLVNFASKIGYIIILISIITSIFKLLWIGILTELIILLFQIITLPVEFNASSRAAKFLAKEALIEKSEQVGSKKMLNAAAMTYVASVLSTLLSVLRLVLIVAGRDDRR